MIINRDIKMVFSWDTEILEMNPGTEISRIEYGKITVESLERKKKLDFYSIKNKLICKKC